MADRRNLEQSAQSVGYLLQKNRQLLGGFFIDFLSTVITHPVLLHEAEAITFGIESHLPLTETDLVNKHTS